MLDRMTWGNPSWNYIFFPARQLPEDFSVKIFEDIYSELADNLGENAEPLISACLLDGLQIWI